jgi:hypothetical protein
LVNYIVTELQEKLNYGFRSYYLNKNPLKIGIDTGKGIKNPAAPQP